MIEFHQGLLADKQKLTSLISPLGNKFAIIVSEELASLYGEKVKNALPDAYLFTFPGGEKSKSRETKEILEDQMLEKGLGRDTCLIAIGGGVTTDLGGFIAATYCRGIPLVMVPTSLLAMVDAGIGGKTGVNTPFGKNLIGAFYQPKKILIDIDVLKTLPEKERRNGLVEMIKHGAIADRAYFEALEKNPKLSEALIRRGCEIKLEIVKEDERENGKRRFLNFGHTVGHALEHLSDYTLAHGEAVAIGMVLESQIAVALGHFDENGSERIEALLRNYGLSLKLPFSLPLKELLNAFVLDKKSEKGQPRFVLLKEIGKPVGCLPVNEKILIQIIKHCL